MFHASEDNLDDLMRAVFSRLLSNRGVFRVEGASKGRNSEVFGALLELKNPRARLSRSQRRARVFSPLGELVWYLAGDNSVGFIAHYLHDYAKYSNDGKIVNGAYGPRLFGKGASLRQQGKSEWNRVMALLKARPDTRNAIIQIYANSDAFAGNNDIPCTCTLHFVVRDDRLHLHTHMRSNDAFTGLPHDIFSFTMLQEIAARELDRKLGNYHHSVASLHLYDDRQGSRPSDRPRSEAEKFIDEGWHDYVPMPEMPRGDQWKNIDELVRVEAQVRGGATDADPEFSLPEYWQDLLNLLKMHAIFQREQMLSKEDASYVRQLTPIKELLRGMSSKVYQTYVFDRLSRATGPVADLFSYLRD